MNLIAQTFCTISTHYGIGRHLATLLSQDTMDAIRWVTITDPFGIMAFCIPKLAVALLLVRIMAPAQQGRWFLYSMAGGVMIAGILNCIFLFVQCKPVTALRDPIVAATATCWKPSVLVNYGYFLGGPCPSSKLWVYYTKANTAYSAFCDFVLAVFPISIMWNLQMPLRRKIGICCLMGLGIL